MKLNVSKKKGVDISKEWIGLFFEDINYGLDGGLHGEMIENRSFEFLDSRGDKDSYYQTFDGAYGWSVYPNESKGSIELSTENPYHRVNPHYLVYTATEKSSGVSNKAYDGIYMEAGVSYRVSFYAKSNTYRDNLEVNIYIEGEKKISTLVEGIENGWKKYEVSFCSMEEIRYGTFVIELLESGTVCFDHISMMPENAVLGVFRKDLAELLKDMKPGFLRFPGGCIIEGNTLENRYQWKLSIGPVEGRKNNWNRWAVHGNNQENNFTSEYKHYNQSLGIGYYEYFLLCEYLKAKPVPVINVGLACQYQSSELVPSHSEEFKEYLQDALDLIEFANGSIDTKYGRIRAQMGHPEPFYMEHIGIGNEQWETEKVDFFKRYTMFQEAIHEKYPDMKLVGSAGPNLTASYYQDAWDFYHKMGKDSLKFTYAVDEHYYVSPEWLMDNTHFYDTYDRDVKVFAGEYAAHCYNKEEGRKNDNYWLAGLSEAAFLTGIERNADVVIMASYAPLFARIGYHQWSPNMIWFNDKSSYATPSYYVQQIYAKEIGEYTRECVVDKEELAHSSTYSEKEGILYIKLVNTQDKEVAISINMEDEVENKGQVIIMEGELLDLNSITQPRKVAPLYKDIVVEKTMNYLVGPYSFHTLKLKVK